MDCFDKNVLKTSKYDTRVQVKKNDQGKLNYTVELPSNLTCEHCVFQVSRIYVIYFIINYF